MSMRTGTLRNAPTFLAMFRLCFPATRPRRTWSVLAFHWQARIGIGPDRFHLPFAVVLDGTIIGTQGINAEDFQALRTFSTGSWLATPWQGQGLAKEMRAAVLTFGFGHLDGTTALSGARHTTERSIKVTTGLGYRENGRRPARFGDDIAEGVDFRLDRADWEALPDRPPVEITGWQACEPMFRPGDTEPT